MGVEKETEQAVKKLPSSRKFFKDIFDWTSFQLGFQQIHKNGIS